MDGRQILHAWSMAKHDVLPELFRWFEKWILCPGNDHPPPRPNAFEWMKIEERVVRCARRDVSHYTGFIGCDGLTPRRVVHFEPGCPPPPTFMHEALAKREPLKFYQPAGSVIWPGTPTGQFIPMADFIYGHDVQRHFRARISINLNGSSLDKKK